MICSLGSFCHTASYLQKNGLKQVSYPFDWALSSPQMVIDCLKDDFKTFLDPIYHQQVDPGISSNHTKYGTMVSTKNFEGLINQNLTFAHKDITQPDTLAYYQRCVERFRTLLALPDRKWFIMCTQDIEYDVKDIHELRDVLQQKTQHATLLCISLFNDIESRYQYDQEDGIRYLKIWSYSRSDGRGFAMERDNEYMAYLIKAIIEL